MDIYGHISYIIIYYEYLCVFIYVVHIYTYLYMKNFLSDLYFHTESLLSSGQIELTFRCSWPTFWLHMPEIDNKEKYSFIAAN